MPLLVKDFRVTVGCAPARVAHPGTKKYKTAKIRCRVASIYFNYTIANSVLICVHTHLTDAFQRRLFHLRLV